MTNKDIIEIEKALYAGIYVRLKPKSLLSRALRIRYLNNEYFRIGRCISDFDRKPRSKIPTLAQAQEIFDRIRQRNWK